MSRKKREESPTGVYHWIVRGINKRDLFHGKEDYEHFRKLLKEYKYTCRIAIYHYCLMTNHVHLLLWAGELEQLSIFSHFVQRRYVYYYCGKYKWNGSVFQHRYVSKIIDRQEYLLECGRYIERNPLKAGLAKAVGAYAYSSFGYYGYGREDELISPSPAYLGLSEDERERRGLYSDYVNTQRIQEEMIAKGLIISDR